MGFFFLIVSTISVLWDGCRHNEIPSLVDGLTSFLDGLHTISKQSQDTAKAKADTIASNLPPMAKAIEPDRLASIPSQPSWLDATGRYHQRNSGA